MTSTPSPRVAVASAAELGEVRRLLAACGLPTDDIRDDAFFVAARSDDALCGTAGIESFGATALLRSVAVHPAWRRKGIARALCDEIMRQARSTGVRRLFLLTTDAERFFRALGFEAVARDALPAEVRATAQFRELCPHTAIAMTRTL